MSDIELISSYDYHLPQELIANSPTMPKEASKLLVYHRNTDEITHHKFGDLDAILPPCDIIFNDTKVIKARIFGMKQSGGKIELLLNSALHKNTFSAYIKGSVKCGNVLIFDENLEAEIIELQDDGLRIIKFRQNKKELNAHEIFEILHHIGHVPLPPYIKRNDTKDDETWYQSIFAKEEGAVAAPTASLHFSQDMLDNLNKKHDFYYLTLHVGAGTFKGVECENIKDHQMHGEYYFMPDDTARLIKGQKPILGVGTTVTRAVEHYARNGIRNGICKLFLNLNNRPIRQNFLLTNFHLPKSTLIMLVTSFIGLEKTMEIYKCAVENKYKFYSYGDGMLIL